MTMTTVIPEVLINQIQEADGCAVSGLNRIGRRLFNLRGFRIPESEIMT